MFEEEEENEAGQPTCRKRGDVAILKKNTNLRLVGEGCRYDV